MIKNLQFFVPFGGLKFKMDIYLIVGAFSCTLFFPMSKQFDSYKLARKLKQQIV